MNRRTFVRSVLSAVAAGAVLDVDKLLWLPNRVSYFDIHRYQEYYWVESIPNGVLIHIANGQHNWDPKIVHLLRPVSKGVFATDVEAHMFNGVVYKGV